MPYENLEELVRHKQQEQAAERSATEQEVNAAIEAGERIERLENTAAELFTAFGGQYVPSDRFLKELQDSQREAPKSRLIPVVLPLDVVKAQPILLGRTGDKYGFAVVGAITEIGYNKEVESYTQKGWFGVMRNRTRSLYVPYVKSVTGYSIEIGLGPKDADLSELEIIDGASTSYAVAKRDIDTFEELLELTQKSDDGSSILVKLPAKQYPGHARTGQGDPGGPVA